MLQFTEILGRVDHQGFAQLLANPIFQTNRVGQENSQQFTVRNGVEQELCGILGGSEGDWTRQTHSVQKQMMFGERGIELPSRQPKSHTAEDTLTDEGVVDVPEAVMDDIDEEELDEDISRVKVETDRAFFNHMLLSRPAAVPMNPAQAMERDNLPFGGGKFVNKNISDRRELIFGDKLHKFLKNQGKKSLVDLMKEAIDESGTDGALGDVWNDVTSVLNRKTSASRDDLTTTANLVEDACKYLQAVFTEHMQTVVERNLEVAERGGIPGTRGLVNAFLKVGTEESFQPEDDSIDGMPTWQVTYHCVRAGDMKSASETLNRLKSFPQCATLVAALNHVAKHGKLDSELKKKLKVEWRHNLAHTKDKYKRALYAALLGGLDSAALADTLENWIWFKLYPLHVDPQLTDVLFKEVQKAVSVDYGEQYFMSNGPSEFQYFFTALWLSGQFERAIYLLHECGQRVDSVHVAVLAHKLGYLRMSKKSTDEMLVVDQNDSTKCHLNLARLIVAYTKSFELVDVPRSLDYWFLLKGITTPTGSDVFEMAVSRSVYLTGQTDEILGKLTPDGRREKGLIDEYLDDPSEVICRVASDTEITGEWDQAVGLYLLASKPTNAAILLSSEISETLRTENKEKIADLVHVAEQFKKVQRGCQASEYATLSLLVDLAVLFDHCRNEEAEIAYGISTHLRLIPTEPDQVTVIVNEFHMVPQKVREVLPDMCLHLMKCLVDHCIRQSTTQANRGANSATTSMFSSSNRYVKQIKAIVLYSATVPYKFPTHVTSRLLQLQASLGI
ncbi:Nuclear pore protein [Caenorhabditis elegans]|uniref:Nuclear pore protein n=2 Tax=Caenorhabditis elegans TaxID=6239 RepID=Q9BKT9_CAEEL|nr:Nuclear pore protein [Caenorhabditis elegans]CCD73434.1 Nuclear pore protein [Caenorhabditis elegans]|eukprot:NP_740802.1 Nuclear pore protein [Caenorhabditis elegans]